MNQMKVELVKKTHLAKVRLWENNGDPSGLAVELSGLYKCQRVKVCKILIATFNKTQSTVLVAIVTRLPQRTAFALTIITLGYEQQIKCIHK